MSFKRVMGQWDGQCIWPQSGDVMALNAMADKTRVTITPYEARSTQHHRRLMGVIKAAFENWPERANFQPENFNHLRSWLAVRAGHYSTITVNLRENSTVAAMALTVEQLKDIAHAVDDEKYPFIKPEADRIVMAIPKTIRFSKMPKSEFTPFAESVEEIIQSILGVSCDELLKNKDKAL